MPETAYRKLARCLPIVMLGCGVTQESAETCTSENHCQRVGGVPTCDEGYTWETPDDPSSGRCIPVTTGCGCDVSDACENKCA